MLSRSSKLCTVCKSNKSIDDFNKKLSSSDGHQNICRVCSSLRSKLSYERNKDRVKKRTRDREKRIRPLIEQLILSYLQKGCIDCGEADIVVLEFDHLYDKKSCISRLINDSTSLDKLEEELQKCEVRCANCHRRKTAYQFGYWKTKLIGA